MADSSDSHSGPSRAEREPPFLPLLPSFGGFLRRGEPRAVTSAAVFRRGRRPAAVPALCAARHKAHRVGPNSRARSRPLTGMLGHARHPWPWRAARFGPRYIPGNPAELTFDQRLRQDRRRRPPAAPFGRRGSLVDERGGQVPT
jgi:hypothetical protein